MGPHQFLSACESSPYDGPAYQATEKELAAEETLHQASPNQQSSLSSHFWQPYVTTPTPDCQTLGPSGPAFPFTFSMEQVSYEQGDFLPGATCVLPPSAHDLMSPHGHGSLFGQDATGLENSITTYGYPVAAGAHAVAGFGSVSAWTSTNDPLSADGPATPYSIGSPGLTDGATPVTNLLSTPATSFLSEPESELEDETLISPNGRRAISRNPASTTRRSRKLRKDHWCEEKECNNKYGSAKDLRRHVESVHGITEFPPYVCRCGAGRSRKDSHKRHVKSCSKSEKKPKMYDEYTCSCGDRCRAAADHIEHLKSCSFGNRDPGRPRNSREPGASGRRRRD